MEVLTNNKQIDLFFSRFSHEEIKRMYGSFKERKQTLTFVKNIKKLTILLRVRILGFICPLQIRHICDIMTPEETFITKFI